MGVGEDETLGEAIAVTIIATGFNKEQQHEITNTEAKKIVHTLEDEQEVVLDLTPKLEVDDIEVVEEKIIKHTLFDDDFEEKIIAEADTLEVIDDAKNIAELEVVYDEVLTENIDDFVITSHIKKEEIILDEIEEDGALSFDFPINERQPQNMVEETEKTYSVAEINDIEVVDAVHIKPEPTFKTAQITYSLEDYLEIEKTLDAVVPKLESDELKIELKTANEKEEKISLDEDNVQISPLDITISELKRRTADRKRKMVDFNFKFKNRLTNIDEIEKEPAYKRMGVDLNDNAPSSATSTSRTTLNLDENDDIQLRSNNSFLHDNVD